MTFHETWHTLLDELDGLPDDATLTAPLTGKSFEITDAQEHRVIIEFRSGDTKPLQRDQFETLYERVGEATGKFDLDRFPIDAEPYAALLALHPEYTINRNENTFEETDIATRHPDLEERSEPDLEIYSDAFLLIDALERYDVDDMNTVETNDLVNLYTLLSDVQRGANEFRQAVTEELLDRIDHDDPVHGQYGSVQRTTRRRRELKDDEHVLDVLEENGVPSERVTGVVEDKVKDALDVVDVPDDHVYDVEEREYVRKAEVEEDAKESRLQGLKDQLAAFEGEDTQELQDEVEELERRIEELTGFDTAREYS
jgi:hypothetical protein